MNNYEERKQARIERYRQSAEKARAESTARYKASHEGLPPFGEPIKIGHHSEGRHRKAIDRSHTNMRKSIEADEKAGHYERKAEAAEHNSAISADDPQALTKLQAKLDGLNSCHEDMKALNKDYKKNGASALESVPEIVKKAALENLNFYSGRHSVPFPAYVIANSNANIKRTQKRLKELQARRGRQSAEYLINGTRVFENVKANRLQILFDDKPTAEMRQRLKSHGFRWSPRAGAWQRQLTNNARYVVKLVLAQPQEVQS